MKADRMAAGDREERDLKAHATGAADEVARWQQQELLPDTSSGVHHMARSNDRLRQAGLTGIAQAREALAEAARRAKAREESRAA